MHGQYPVYRIISINPRYGLKGTNPQAQHDDDSWYYYEKTIDFCKAHGADVIVTTLPDNRWTYGRHKEMKKLLKDKGVVYLDYNVRGVLEKLHLDWRRDFYNAHHVNPVGAEKTTKYLGEYLIKHYDLPQWKCSDQLKKQFDSDYRLYKKDLKKFIREKYSKK